MICLYSLDHSQLSDKDLNRFKPLLPADRQARAEKYRRREDAAACIGAGMLLRFALLKHIGTIPAAGPLTGVNGKPYYDPGQLPPGSPAFHFNLSHSGDLVVLAADASAVGIDLQQISACKKAAAIAGRFFTDAERRFIEEGAPGQAAARFALIWALKESYVKYLGTGLSSPLTGFSVDPDSGRVTRLCTDPSPASAGCGADALPDLPGESPRLRHRRLGDDYMLGLCFDPSSALSAPELSILKITPDQLI